MNIDAGTLREVHSMDAQCLGGSMECLEDPE